MAEWRRLSRCTKEQVRRRYYATRADPARADSIVEEPAQPRRQPMQQPEAQQEAVGQGMHFLDYVNGVVFAPYRFIRACKMHLDSGRMGCVQLQRIRPGSRTMPCLRVTL